VTVREGFRVSGVLFDAGHVVGVEGFADQDRTTGIEYRASLTIAADGPNSLFHRDCGVKKIYARRRRYGMTGHLTGVAATDPVVEVFLRPDLEVYLAPVSEGRILAALLLEQEALGALGPDPRSRYESVLRTVPELVPRLGAAEVTGPILMAGPLGFRVDRCVGDGYLLLGDSAGFLDPITGEGMALALQSACAAAPVVVEALAKGDVSASALSGYAQRRAELASDLTRITRMVLLLSRFPWLADRAVSRLGRDRGLFEKLLGVVSGRHGYDRLDLRDKLALLAG
jgi:flavin-dependent dehydrogenase